MLLGLVPAPYRWLALLVAALALVGFGWVKGAQHTEQRLVAAQLQAEREASRLGELRRAATARIDAKYAKLLRAARGKTITIVQEVDRYVPASDCPLSAGFRVFHDAAASGEVPDPARIAHGAAVSAKEAAATVADNYGACREDQLKLQGLQEWIREQQGVK